jgi:hypothetical protein
VRQANLLLGDIGQTATLEAENRLGEAQVTAFRPIKFILASPESTAAAIWEQMTEAGYGSGDCFRSVATERPTFERVGDALPSNRAYSDGQSAD